MVAHVEGQTVAPIPLVRLGLTDAECRALVEQQPLVTYVDGLGEHVETLFISSNVLELSGYPASWWRSPENDFFSILHPGDVDAVRAAHIASAREGTPYKSDFRLVKPSGEIVWVQAEDRPILGDDGVPLYRLGYLVDVTERRGTEDALRKTGTRLTTLIDSLHMAVLLEDERRHVALTNQAFCDIFAIPVAPADLVGADCAAAAQQSKLLAADPDAFLARIDEILAAREAVQGEEVEFADGRVFERDYTPILIDREHGGHLWGYHDVTPRIDAQRAIEEAHDEAVAASQSKSEFLATVSHEIRTPMHGVIGTLDLLQRTALDGEQAELAAIARSSATALLAVINDMLDLQRAETGHTVLANVPLDIVALVGGVADTLRATAEAKGLELVARVADEVPGDLLGDPGRLRQVLLNLVGNAVKFTPSGRVAVEATHGAFDAESAELVLTVSDTGIGIDAATQACAFEPFAQADASSARSHEGTGLGLAITRQLVELMGGTIELRSIPGDGTVVTAVVRLRRGAGATAPAQPPALALVLRGTILVVEDNAVNCEIATRQLERLGLEAHVVESGAAALDALEHGRYDAVLMDMRMPRMTGIQATEALRVREHETGRRRVPVIAMTANARAEDRAACLRAGMDAFATKPLTLDDLGRAVGPWLSGAGDVEAALDRMAVDLGSTAPVRKTVQTWLAELPERLDDLDAASRDRDAERLRDGAHTLKSTCALVGAEAAAKLASDLERRAADGDASGSERVDALRQAAGAAAERVRDWVHAQPADAAP